MSPRLLMALAAMVTLALLLQLLACVLYHNWWPALGLLVYVLIPMPYLFFGASDGSQQFYGDSGSDCWVEAGKFLAGLSATGAVAIPCTLAHAGAIGTGALVFSLSSTATLGAAVVVYERYGNMDEFGDAFYY